MTKKTFIISSILFFGMCIAAFTSCSSEVDDLIQESTKVNPGELHTCTMNFNAEMPSFEKKTRAASSASWEDGAKVYLRFTSPLGITIGTAVYNAAKGNWTLSYYGSLYEGTANTCTAVYVENPSSVEGTVISLSERSAIFEDKSGSYIVNEGDLTVTATLMPKVGRIHLSGTEGKRMKVFGLSHYTSYNYNTDLYTNTNERFDYVVNNDGYTDYVYVFFSDEASPSIKLWIDGKETYTRFFSSNVLAAGESGVMTIPTIDSHSGWTDGLTFKIDDAIMTMLPVEGGSFIMGTTTENDPNASTNETPAHVVTLSSYCIGETEVTSEFYNKATNSTDEGTNKPIRYSNRGGWIDFVNALNKKTGAKFNLPTEAQWEFAARGGKKSHNYLYSGSDNIDEVAWYYSNSSNKIQPVKQKKPNELGLYDMSGNADEICRDFWYTYTNTSVTDPIGSSTSSYPVGRGGSYSQNATYSRITSRISWSYSSYSYIGARVVIEM